VKRVLHLQGKRETTHFLFDRGLGEYLAEKGKPNAGNFEQYKLVAHEVTESFKGLSGEIIQLRDACALPPSSTLPLPPPPPHMHPHEHGSCSNHGSRPSFTQLARATHKGRVGRHTAVWSMAVDILHRSILLS
jgi:hypothetical protein